LLEDLEKDLLLGQDCYPKLLTAAFSLLTNWKQSSARTNNETPNNGVSFLNTDEHEKDGKGPDMALATYGEQKTTYKGKNFDKSKVTCHQCGKKGH
jgi:hypothetical protein